MNHYLYGTALWHLRDAELTAMARAEDFQVTAAQSAKAAITQLLRALELARAIEQLLEERRNET